MTNPEFPDGKGGGRGASANLKGGVRRPIILAIFPRAGRKWKEMDKEGARVPKPPRIRR